ncbi:hypothetical protein COM00_15060 [Bacillus toyonensis]|nr:hypothetical protein COM00_15060 [Bacillus toyonensis]
MKKYLFYGIAIILFPCACKYRNIFANFPDISQEIDRGKQDVNSRLEVIKRFTRKDDKYCYQELINFVRSIQKHLKKQESNWDITRYAIALEAIINGEENYITTN